MIGDHVVEMTDTGTMQISLLARFARFALVGLLATMVQYCLLIVGVEVGRLSPTLSSGLGFVVGAILNYILNYRFTFQSSRSHWSAAYRFLLVAGVGLLLNVLLMQLMTRRWRLQYVMAQMIVTIIVLFWNFSGNAFWAFVTPAARRLRPAPGETSR